VGPVRCIQSEDTNGRGCRIFSINISEYSLNTFDNSATSILKEYEEAFLRSNAIRYDFVPCLDGN